MSKSVNRSLFDLIKSMSKSEKRYFKLHSSKHTIGEVNKYVLLFDYLDNCEDYDEDSVLNHFKHEPFTNRFSITKKRLYDQILGVLCAYNLSNSIQAQVAQQIHSIDLLYEKSLYDQCARQIRSSEKLAKKYHLDEFILILQKKKQRLIATQGYSSFSEKDAEEIQQDVANSLDGIQKIHHLWNIKSRLFSRLTQNGIVRCEEERSYYDELCGFLVDNDSEPERIEEKYLVNHILSGYYYAIGSFESSLGCLEDNIELFKTTSIDQYFEPNRYFSILTNAIYIADKLGLHTKSMIYLGELKKVASELDANDDLQIKLFSSTSSIELSLFLRKGQFEKAHQLTEEIENKIVLFGDKLTPSRQAFLHFKCSVAYMGVGEYSQALKSINKILNNSKVDQNEDIIGFSLLLELFIHLELMHTKLLEYALKNVQRHFRKRQRLFEFEKTVIHYIGKLIKCESILEQKIIWELMVDKMKTLTSQNQFESIALDYFDFQSWAESKSKNQKFETIIQRKYNEHVRVAS